MDIRFAAKTDVGMSRAHNEDHFWADPATNLYIVADGMGGHNAGEVASAMAVQVTRDALQREQKALREFKENSRDQERRERVRQVLENAVKEACYKIFEQGLNNSAQRGMGTTLTLGLVLGTRMFIAHVGDSRLYLKREGEVHQLTQDHSMLNELIRHGKVTSLKDLDHRFKNAVTRAVGVHESVEVDVLDVDLLPGDRVLICSDGLHGYMDESMVGRELEPDDLEGIAANLVQLANRKGGKDNITHIILEAVGNPSEYPLLYLKNATIRSLGIFQHLNFEEITRVLSTAAEKSIRPGEVVFEEGKRDPRLIVLLEGELELQKGKKTWTKVGPGTHFGEVSIVADSVRESRAIAAGPGTILVFEQEVFYRLLREDTCLAVKCMWSLLGSLGNRVQVTMDAIKQADPELLDKLAAESPEALGVTRPMNDPKRLLPEGLLDLVGGMQAAPPPPPPPPPGGGR